MNRLSETYQVRKLTAEDISAVFTLCSSNPLFYRYCPPAVTKENIAADMQALPPNTTEEDKYYLGYFEKNHLIAVLDLILGYPEEDTAYIGFFMVDANLQKKGLGSEIIGELCNGLSAMHMNRLKLAWAKGNPQAEHFWKKNGFRETGTESDMGEYIAVQAQREL